jgi:hypothetical protein
MITHEAVFPEIDHFQSVHVQRMRNKRVFLCGNRIYN